MKKPFTNKIIAIVMAAMMAVMSLPVTAFAAGNETEAPATSERSVQEAAESTGSGIQDADTDNSSQDEAAGNDAKDGSTEDDAQNKDTANKAPDTDTDIIVQDADSNAKDSATGNDAQDAVVEKGAQDNDADADNAAQDSDAVNGAKNGTRGVPDGSILEVSSWDELYNACVSAPDNVSTTIVLSEDITRPSDSENDRIEINNKKVIVLNLNDKTLHANRTSAGNYYHVLDVHEGGNLTVLDSGFSGTIKGGYANYGGGIYISEGGTCTIEGGTISSNYAEEKGGGIYTEGTLIMTGGTISSNCASSQDGGGIYCTRSGMIQLKNVYIRENDANDYGSGIMIVLGNDDSYIQECYFEKNGFNYFKRKFPL